MYVVSTHEHTIFLEMAMTVLEQRGIAKQQIMAIPLERKMQYMAVFDTMHQADGISNLDGAAVLGTILMVLGTIYGFIWAWGPIIWGLIGLLVGGAVGVVIKVMLNKRHRTQSELGKATEVVLLINCAEHQAEMVEDILWTNKALGVARIRG